VLSLQTPAAWHGPGGPQVIVDVTVQTPDLHDAVSQRPDAGQAVPSASTGVEHVPVEGSHVPAPWQLSIGKQVTGFE
jgi:hypothetical protein